MTESGDALTIAELAARTGLSVRTVRFYAAQGLLPLPERRGRIALYSAEHRLRLEFISELQDHGYSLASIERYLARIPVGASAGDFAVHRALLAPWQPQHADSFDRPALQRRAGRSLSDADLEFLISMGLISMSPTPMGTAPSGHAAAGDRTAEAGATQCYRTTPANLAMGVQLLELPVPMEVLLEASAVIERHAVAVAEGLTDVFRKGIWEPYQRGEQDPAQQQQLAAVVAGLRPLAVQGLVAAFERAADRAVGNGPVSR